MNLINEDQNKIKITYTWYDLDKNLRFLISTIRKRLRKDWDLVMAISGEEGCGKSTLGILVGALIDKRFNMVDNLALLPDEKEIVREYTKLKRYQCYVIDEAIRALYKMSFMSRMTQTLVRMWATERFQNKGTILIIPRFKDLTENFRNHRVKLWIHVLARGTAVAYVRDDDPHTFDPWHFKEAQNYKKLASKKKPIASMSVEQRVRIESKMKNYLFTFSFPDLPEDVKKVYQRLKIQSRRDLKTDEEKVIEKKTSNALNEARTQRDKLIFKMIRELGVSRKEIQKQFDLKQSQVTRILHKVEKIKAEEQLEEEIKEDEVGVHRLLDTALKIEEMKNKNEN